MRTMFAIALTPFLVHGAMQAKSEVCQSPFHVMHADVRHTESKGIGYKDGYTTLEWFGIYQSNPNFMPFLDLRGHVFNDGQLAGNIGLGERTIFPSINHMFGLYLYYDARQGEHDLSVNQLSPGVELLGKRMEYRINAYFPVGRDESHRYHYKFNRFQGNRIILQNKKKFAMTGADAEVGAHITQSTRHDFYFGIGPYYLTANPNHAWGGKSRLYWRYKEYISLEASYSYDHIFKNIVQGTVAFSYPFGNRLKRKGKGCPSSNDLALSRAAFAPYRFEIPVVETRQQHSIARNAAGQPLNIWFVRNTSSSNGTYESPFSTLVAAQNASGPNDIIYVFQGDGTSRGMNAGIILKNNQTLFGSGTQQTISTSKGRMTIPAQTLRAPTITNAPGISVVTLANGNEISGMIVVAADGITAFGAITTPNFLSPAQSVVDGTNIHHNVILASGGIRCRAIGNVNINNNVFIADPLAGGIPLAIDIDFVNDGFANVNITNNTITNYRRGIELSKPVFFSAPDASGNAVIANNTITNYTLQAVLIRPGLINSNISVLNNRIVASQTAGGSDAINIQPWNGSRYTIDGNTITLLNTALAAPGITVQNPPFFVSAEIAVTNNQITANGNGISLRQISPNATYCTNISNNQVTLIDNAALGIRIEAASGTINITDFSNNITPTTSVGGAGIINFVAPGSCGP